MQRSVAVTAIGPLALRNQGDTGVIDAAREFLARLEIPLDSAVARGLKKLGTRGELPFWPGLKKQ